MIRLFIIILVLTGCTVQKAPTKTRYKVILDASPSHVKGGDGRGYLKTFEWTQTEGPTATIANPHAVKTFAIVSDTGVCAFRIKITNNLNKKDTATLKVDIKGNEPGH